MKGVEQTSTRAAILMVTALLNFHNEDGDHQFQKLGRNWGDRWDQGGQCALAGGSIPPLIP